jgi:hypothetical protein
MELDALFRSAYNSVSARLYRGAEQQCRGLMVEEAYVYFAENKQNHAFPRSEG